MSQQKLVHHSNKAICLGVEIDTVECIIFILQEKLLNIIKSVNVWLNRPSCTKSTTTIFARTLVVCAQVCQTVKCFLKWDACTLEEKNYDSISFLWPKNSREIYAGFISSCKAMMEPHNLTTNQSIM